MVTQMAKKLQKIFWFCVYALLISFTLLLVFSLWDRFTLNPTMTTLESRIHPVTEIPYPAISLCKINKISKRRADALATQIANQIKENRTKIMESIKFLANLYDYSYDISDRGEIDYFQNILDGLQLKIREIMRNLTTPCEDFLKICHWKGVAVNCSKIFQLRRTFEGDCCTFNYFKITQDWWMRRDDFSNLTHGEPGTQNGLSVLVNDEPEDYYCTVISSMGINVQVFIPGDYPDKASGGLIESICDIGSENFLEVIPTTVAAVADVMNHPVDKRQCLFEEEELTQFGVYSQSDCFVDCRMRSMMALCQCIPFTIPWSTDPTACTLRDLPCLNRYREKWKFLVPDDNIRMREREDALLCRRTCYPSCGGTSYEVRTSAIPLQDPKLKNSTIIHVYYRERHYNLYKYDVVYYWFEILSNFGGVFCLVMGFSLVSLIEICVYSVRAVVVRLFKI